MLTKKKPTSAVRGQAGFTLVELLTVVAIVAILSAIGIPAYTKYVQRGDLVAGTQALSQFRVQMEQYYQDNHTYGVLGVNGVAACGVAVPTASNFTLACVAAGGGQSYLATATGTGPILGAVYTIDQGNNQVTLSLPAGLTAIPNGGTAGWIMK